MSEPAISTSAPIAAATVSQPRSETAPGSARTAAVTGTTASSASGAAASAIVTGCLAAGARQAQLALGARQLVVQQRAQLRAALARRGGSAGVLQGDREQAHPDEPMERRAPAGAAGDRRAGITLRRRVRLV